MSTTFLGLGSNLGDSKQILDQAIIELKKIGTVVAVSSFYKTEPVGFTDQPWFINCVVKMETALAPRELLLKTQAMEIQFGRERTVRFGPRTLDIDILFYDDVVLHEEDLILPHPRLHERRFVLEPLSEIALLFFHPVYKQTITHLLETLPDRSRVERILGSPHLPLDKKRNIGLNKAIL